MTMGSSDADIEYLESLTSWKNRDDVIRFLEMCEWNLENAVEVFLSRPAETENTSVRPVLPLSNSTKNPSPSTGSNEPFVVDGGSSQQPSRRLYRSLLSPPVTPNELSSPFTATEQGTTRDAFEKLFQTELDADSPTLEYLSQCDQLRNKRGLLQYIDENVIGTNQLIQTPWGRRKMVYADYTASGRGLWFIEKCILNDVLPFYANTHSENTASALRTTKFREESRALIKRCLNASDEDVLIFTGAGSTSAINKLVRVLNLEDEQVRSKRVVFVSTFEHHSNILPWQESGVEVVRIPNTREGVLDRDELKKQLERYTTEKKKIFCTFNAASNVTGIRTDVDSISRLVHEHNGTVFWDYAAAAPYVNIDMNPPGGAWKDAVFISTHKFVGGPSTPGILVAKRSLFTNAVPVDRGGGTVNYVTRDRVEYVQDIETREEGGTPSIIDSIRAGFVFHLKKTVGPRVIEAREDELVGRFFARFRNHPTLNILGSTTVPRLAIFSFLVYVESVKRYLHHHFVCALLNDLFGIQARSGCSCAGPYVLDLLNIDETKADIYADFITQDENGRFSSAEKSAMMKPGFTRLNLSYFASDKEVNYILDALQFVAEHGWKFLPFYTYDPSNASWHPRHQPHEDRARQFRGLDFIVTQNGTSQHNGHRSQSPPVTNVDHRSLITTQSDDPIEQANSILANIPEYVFQNIDFRSDPPLNIPNEYRDYIWFVTPREIIRKIVNDYENNRERPQSSAPFGPRPN